MSPAKSASFWIMALLALAAAGCASRPPSRAMTHYVPRASDRSPWLWEESVPAAAAPAPTASPAVTVVPPVAAPPVVAPPVVAPVPPPPTAGREKPVPPVAVQPQAPSNTGASASVGRVLRRGEEVIIQLRAIPSPEDVREVVDENGCVTLPYVGRIRIEGKTSSEAEQMVERAYVEGQFYPKIDVIVVPEAEEYFLRGEVARPGRYPLMRDMTLLQSVAAAGGYTDFASSKIRVFRGERVLDFSARQIERGRARDPLVKPGDIIVVRRRFLWW